MLKSCDVMHSLAHMLTYMSDSLLALRHSKSSTMAVCKDIFSAHMWQPYAATESPDYRFVNGQSADHDRHLRVCRQNVPSLANKSAAVHEIIVTQSVVPYLSDSWASCFLCFLWKPTHPSTHVSSVWLHLMLHFQRPGLTFLVNIGKSFSIHIYNTCWITHSVIQAYSGQTDNFSLSII